MWTSKRGVDLIKSFEGFSSVAIKLKGEQYYTIGYGHYGPDVKAGQRMTREEAEILIRKDLQQFEGWVNQYAPWPLNQNEFDALVSFTYNCGPGSLQSLVRGRTKAQVAQHMLEYTRSASPAYTAGLLARRKKEQALFLEEDMERWNKLADIPTGYYRDQVQRLIREGILAGDESGLNLTEDMLRCILIAERAAKKAVKEG